MTKIVTETKTMIQMQKKEGEHIESMSCGKCITCTNFEEKQGEKEGGLGEKGPKPNPNPTPISIPNPYPNTNPKKKPSRNANPNPSPNLNPDPNPKHRQKSKA